VTGARISILALAATLAAAAPARADTSDREEIIISDAVSDLLIASVASPGVTSHLHGIPVGIGFAGALLGGPIIHASHDDWGRAGISFGTRIVYFSRAPGVDSTGAMGYGRTPARRRHRQRWRRR